MAEADNQPKCPKCGAPSERDYTPSNSQGHWKEYASDALGVHPDQVPEMKKMFPHHRFNSQGQMLIGSHTEFKRVLKDLGMVDRNREVHSAKGRRFR